jgi:GSH-dependent disulfide-bond oxidoreductase
MDTKKYTPPRVWKAHTDHGGKYALMNRPTAGARHQAELPRGKHPLQLYSQGTWNGIKVTVMLEELLALGVTRAEYDAWLIDISKNEQFGSGFVELNPNSKIPALVDYSAEQPVKVFESGAILLYLAEKSRRSYHARCLLEWNACLGCSGKWEVRRTWVAVLHISIDTHRLGLNILSTATRWK